MGGRPEAGMEKSSGLRADRIIDSRIICGRIGGVLGIVPPSSGGKVG